MKKSIIAAAIALLPFAVMAQDAVKPEAKPEAKSESTSWFPTPIALPGFTWGSLQYPSTTIKGIPDSNNLLYQGRTEQGADWVKFGSNKEFTFNTFVALGYSADHEGLPYNNYLRPQIGAKIRHNWTNGGMGELGVAYQWDDRFKSTYNGVSYPSHGNGVVVYYNYFGSWDLKNRGN